MPDDKEMLRRARELRKQMTPQERKLWYDYLRTHPVKFRKQHIMGDYILDFYCPAAALVIEIDGSQHYTKYSKEYDTKRSAFLHYEGFRIIRYPNTLINKNFSGVCEHIDKEVQDQLRRIQEKKQRKQALGDSPDE